MKRLPFLALVLFTFAAPLQAEEEQKADSCRASFELGRLDARGIPTRKWFWRSYALTCLLVTGSFAYEMQNDNYESEGIVLISAGYVSLAASIVLPLAVKPGPASAPPDDPAVDRDCYQAGYTRRLKGRNTLASLGGYAAGWATAYVIAVIFFLPFFLFY
jgi:hypothetical protein